MMVIPSSMQNRSKYILWLQMNFGQVVINYLGQAEYLQHLYFCLLLHHVVIMSSSSCCLTQTLWDDSFMTFQLILSKLKSSQRLWFTVKLLTRLSRITNVKVSNWLTDHRSVLTSILVTVPCCLWTFKWEADYNVRNWNWETELSLTSLCYQFYKKKNLY